MTHVLFVFSFPLLSILLCKHMSKKLFFCHSKFCCRMALTLKWRGCVFKFKHLQKKKTFFKLSPTNLFHFFVSQTQSSPPLLTFPIVFSIFFTCPPFFVNLITNFSSFFFQFIKAFLFSIFRFLFTHLRSR